MGQAKAYSVRSAATVSVVVRRMYYWDISYDREKEKMAPVSVVVRRMYYWDAAQVIINDAAGGFSSC